MSTDQEQPVPCARPWRQWCAGGLAATAWAAAVAAVVAVPNFLIGTDGYFHVAVAAKLPAHGWALQAFPWVSESVWVENYFDKEWLFHVLVAGLLPAGRLAAGKLAVVLCNGFIAVAFWWLFGRLEIKQRFWWTLALPFVTFGIFFERLCMCRPHLLSLALLALGLGCIIRRYPLRLALVTAVYALSYTGHWQMLGIALWYDVLYVFLDVDGRRRRRWPRRLPMLLPVFLGMVAGELVHPNFPANIRGLWYQNVQVLAQHWQGGSDLHAMRPAELRSFGPALW